MINYSRPDKGLNEPYERVWFVIVQQETETQTHRYKKAFKSIKVSYGQTLKKTLSQL